MTEDYPRDVTEFEHRFSSDQACRDYLAKLRWPDGWKCAACGGLSGWPLTGGRLWECRLCGHQSSVTAGTIFHDARRPLTLWFRAMWLVTVQKNGCSAVSLQRNLGLCYETAFAWLHKLRRCMIRPGREMLSGAVQVGHGHLKIGEDSAKPGQRERPLIVVAAEEDGRNIGRIRLAHIADASAARLHGFLEETVASGSRVTTKGWAGYTGVEKFGYVHHVRTEKARGKQTSGSLPIVSRVMILLERWILGTHQGAISEKHLAHYLDEFTFRFNRRSSANRGKLFYRLCQQCVQAEPAPYHVIGFRPKRTGR